MSRGILTVRDDMSFEDIDAMLGSDDGGGIVTQLDVPAEVPELGPAGPAEMGPPSPGPMITPYSDLYTPSAPDSGTGPIVTSYSQLGPLPSQAPAAAAAPAQNFQKSANQIVTSAGQVYGSYATNQAGKAASRSKGAARPAMPAQSRTAIAPTSAGLSPTAIALIAGGGVLVVGILVVLLVT